MSRDPWTLSEARARFGEIVKRTLSGRPQTVTKTGLAAVVIAADTWERKTKRVGTLADFFAASPLRGSRLRISRNKERPRKIDS